MARKIVVASTLLFVSWAWFGLFPKEIRATEEGKDVPKIIEFFAAKRMKPGSLWKIYLNASFPEGKMKKFVAQVDQVGQHDSYPISFTRIKEENQQELSGYLSLNIPGQNLNNVNLKLTLQIQYNPKGGVSSGATYSQAIECPLSISDACMFNNTCVDETPPGGVFKENYLGPIMVHLEASGRRTGSGIEAQ